MTSEAASVSTDAVQAELAAERDVLTHKINELDSREDNLDFDGGFADSAQVAAEQGENKVLYDQLRKDLDDIEKALGRIDEGTYGTCEVCGETIGADRLEVMPSTSRCITHA